MGQHWRLDVLLKRAGNVHHCAAPGTTQPLVAVADVKVWLQLLKVDGQHA
jgi:hypothetical protein